MGLFTKSLMILLIAVSTPLLYRQFANDNTVKFMSSYYSNYKLIDQFLRQSANHIESAKNYLPDSEQFNGVVKDLRLRVDELLASAKSTIKPPTTSKESKKDDERTSKEKKMAEVKAKKEKEQGFNVVKDCPGEDLGGQQVRLWNKQELAKYDGNSEESDIYLGFLGLVYNVTVNSQHYAAGAEYNIFAGRDATRAFVTGNFTHDLHDNIRDIDQSLYSHIDSWESFYKTSYPIVGRIEGQFYDSKGCGTQELVRVYQIIDQLGQEKENDREQEKIFPECNSEWNSETNKGRVWCSTKSGGVERDWAGVPRIYNNGVSQLCACVDLNSPQAKEQAQFMQLYPGCSPTADECPVKQ